MKRDANFSNTSKSRISMPTRQCVCPWHERSSTYVSHTAMALIHAEPAKKRAQKPLSGNGFRLQSTITTGLLTWGSCLHELTGKPSRSLLQVPRPLMQGLQVCEHASPQTHQPGP